MVATHSNNAQEEWQIGNLYRFQKTKCNHKERPIPITFYKWSSEHNNRVWSIFLLRWVFRISSNPYSFKGHIKNCICYRLGGFYMKGDVVWNLKWTSNILKNYYQNIQRIFGQVYEDIFGWLYNEQLHGQSSTKAHIMFSKVQKIWQ